MFDARAANRKRIVPRAESMVKAKAQGLSYKPPIYALYLVLLLFGKVTVYYKICFLTRLSMTLKLEYHPFTTDIELNAANLLI